MTDKHHPAGKANDLTTVEIDVNDHWAELSTAQCDWPKETLENPHRSPLRRAAACVRGFIDMLWYLIKKFLLWIADMLEILDDYLVQQLGSDWWKDTPLAAFAPPGLTRE